MTSSTPRVAGRLVTLIAGLVIAFSALEDAASRMRGPIAVALMQSGQADGRLVGRQFDALLTATGGKSLPTSGCWTCRAKAAIARDPLDPAPLRILGLYAEQSQGRTAARKYMLLAEEVSRRDASTQGWLIGDAASLGDFAQLLAHYDRMLSVHDELYATLFPPLAQTLSDASIQDRLADFIRRDRPWVSNFMIEAGPMVSDPRHLKAMYERVDRGGKALPATLRAQQLLVGQLAAAGHFAEGLAQARRIAGEDRAELDNLGFPDGEVTEAYLPYTWTRGDNRAIGTSFEGSNGVIVENSTGSEALALYRLRVLTPGRYEMSAAIAPVEGYDTLSGRWEVYCVKGQAQQLLARMQMQDRASQGTVSFEVTTKCTATRFDFRISENTSSSVALMRVMAPNLRRAR